MQAEELLKAAGSVEYLIFQHMQRIAAGYAELTNAKKLDDGKVALGEIQAAAIDLQSEIHRVLLKWDAPDALILNVNSRALKVWSFDALTGLWLNANQFYARFIHATSKESKVKQLTAFYHLIKDLVDCSLSVKAEDYYGKNYDYS